MSARINRESMDITKEYNDIDCNKKFGPKVKPRKGFVIISRSDFEFFNLVTLRHSPYFIRKNLKFYQQ